MSMHVDGGSGTKYFQAARSCDYCESAAALLFCRADSAFLCISCDSQLHVSHSKHERVWMCEVCEQAPAVVACKADAAVLCSDCDRDIHSANPLARRHDRTPVVPFYENAESVVLKSAAAPFVSIHNPTSSSGVEQADLLTNASLWIPTKLPAEGPDVKSIEFLFSDSDQLLDFDFDFSQQISSRLLSDCVVPVQTTTKPPVPSLSPQNYSSENRFEIDFTSSNVNSYNISSTTSSLNHSVSSSSMDLGVVPDSSAMSDISYPFPSNVINSVVDLSGNQGFPVLKLDREARVLRYREKRKNRRFQKTIRYASRKAYAETRPRVKGRFAKRTDGELEGEPVFISGSPDYVFDTRYDVVMSF